MYYTVYFLQIQVHIITDDMYTGKWQLEITRYRDYVEKYKHFDRNKKKTYRRSYAQQLMYLILTRQNFQFYKISI